MELMNFSKWSLVSDAAWLNLFYEKTSSNIHMSITFNGRDTPLYNTVKNSNSKTYTHTHSITSTKNKKEQEEETKIYIYFL